MVVVALLLTLPFKHEDQYLLPVKISSWLLLPFLIYSLISLQKALRENHLPPKIFWSIRKLLFVFLVRKTHISNPANNSNYSLDQFRNYGAQVKQPNCDAAVRSSSSSRTLVVYSSDFLQVSSAKRLLNISGTVRDREEVKVSKRLY
jgi:hypothetical protein